MLKDKKVDDKEMKKSKPSAKRLKRYDFDKLNEEFEKNEIVRQNFQIKASAENYRKLEAISATKNISKEKIINPLLDEKIMSIDVVEYVDKIESIDFDMEIGLYGRRIDDIKLSSEAYRRLKIFAGIKNIKLEDFIEKYVSEIINEIDLINLVKNEFS